MTQQRIRIRTDIFQSREFASVKEKADGVPFILTTPVPSRQNDEFNHIDDIDEPEVVCLGNGKDWDWDYNDNRSFKDLPHHTVKDIQVHSLDDEQSLDEDVKKGYKTALDEWERKLQIFNSKVNVIYNERGLEGVKKTLVINSIDFVNGIYSCSVCQIKLMKNDIDSHLKGKRHAKLAESPARKAPPQPKVEDLKEQIIKDEWFEEEIKESAKTKESTKTKEFIKTKEKQFTFNSSEALIYKSIDFVNGSYSCSVCQIELKERDLFLHLQGKRHAKRRAQKEKDKKEYRLSKKHAVKAKKLATKNEISSRKFLIKEFLNGSLKQLCILCDTVVKSERLINAHFSGQKHKANYERYTK